MPTNNGKPRKVGFIKMQIIPDLKANTIDVQVYSCISDEANLITNDLNSYIDFESIVQQHQTQVIPRKRLERFYH